MVLSTVGKPRKRGGRIIAIANLKGGTGKSTLAVNLTCALAQSDRSICLVDCDPQATSCQWLLENDLKIRALKYDIKLWEVGQWITDASALCCEHDIVVVDLPGAIGPVTAAACLTAHLVLVPTSGSAVELAGTRRALRYLERVAAERRHAPPTIMLAPNRTDGSPTALQNLARLAEDAGIASTPPIVGASAFADAFADRKWIGAAAPESEAHHQIAALAATVVEKLQEGGDTAGARGCEGSLHPADRSCACPTETRRCARSSYPPPLQKLASLAPARSVISKNRSWRKAQLRKDSP